MARTPEQEIEPIREAFRRANAKQTGPHDESGLRESHVVKALRYATDKVNRENKHPDEPPLVMPGDVPER